MGSQTKNLKKCDEPQLSNEKSGWAPGCLGFFGRGLYYPVVWGSLLNNQDSIESERLFFLAQLLPELWDFSFSGLLFSAVMSALQPRLSQQPITFHVRNALFKPVWC